MLLRVWLKQSGVQQREVARALGVHFNSFRRYMDGERRWPLDLALGVVELTNGAVGIADLCGPRRPLSPLNSRAVNQTHCRA